MRQIYKSSFRQITYYFGTMKTPLDWDTFLQVEMRVGRIIQVEVFEEARNPSYIVTVDFGPDMGVKKTSAQVTKRYETEDLLGKTIVCVVNFPPKQIGPIMSDFLLLGAMDETHGTAVLEVPSDVPLGTRIG
jgi:tRNA-binding protein